ncbi:hypothetical protein [Streptomyces sp. NBC_00083]|uniref:hypothetical protein n=1 Tax=Streptomyces sp. NBC_00083 TaxID=2975647 RepID=UPI002259B6A3|nr:hypothetical protein [Streptomyces sp. NBC_00083]MCX5383243.1 hypothetical protein [Streptomyces sp. NBC_00083]
MSRPLRVTERRALALLLLLLVTAAGLAAPSVVRAATAPEAAPVPAPEPFGAACRTSVQGSHAVAYCHNPYPDVDRVRLHTDCAMWWDLDADAAPVDVFPGQTVRLIDRCWKGVGAVWVTHQKVS